MAIILVAGTLSQFIGSQYKGSYTLGLVVVMSLYSKIIEGGNQGLLMGLFSGSIARMLVPLVGAPTGG